MQKPLNDYIDLSRSEFDLRLHLQPYNVYVSSKGSGESVHLHRLV